MFKTQKARSRLVTAILLLSIELAWFFTTDLKHFFILNGIAIVILAIFWFASQVGRWIERGDK